MGRAFFCHVAQCTVRHAPWKLYEGNTNYSLVLLLTLHVALQNNVLCIKQYKINKLFLRKKISSKENSNGTERDNTHYVNGRFHEVLKNASRHM